jgi:hypothetical protein
MSINVNILKRSLKDLPTPKHEGEVLNISVPSRVEELEMIKPVTDEGVDPPIDTRISRFITCVATRYCENSECWLEWELDL